MLDVSRLECTGMRLVCMSKHVLMSNSRQAFESITNVRLQAAAGWYSTSDDIQRTHMVSKRWSDLAFSRRIPADLLEVVVLSLASP